MTKCNLELSKACDGIRTLAFDDPPHGKGVFLTTRKHLNLKKETSEIFYPQLIYQYGRKKNEFIWLSYCPMCGVKLK